MIEVKCPVCGSRIVRRTLNAIVDQYASGVKRTSAGPSLIIEEAHHMEIRDEVTFMCEECDWVFDGGSVDLAEVFSSPDGWCSKCHRQPAESGEFCLECST